jgi:UDP-3-O-[3-hydroxymyristoyl] glucosamine N-acyltransferase
MIPAGFDLELRNIRSANPRSRFEIPCVIQRALRRDHRVDIGAFTAIYGGCVGHSRIGRYCSIAPECIVAQDESIIERCRKLQCWR